MSADKKRLFALHIGRKLDDGERDTVYRAVKNKFRECGHDWELIIFDEGDTLTELTNGGEDFEEADLKVE